MLKRILLVAAVLVPQFAAAADLRVPRAHRHAARRAGPVVEGNPVVNCTTTDFGLFSYAHCGQGLDPLAVVGN